MLFASSLADVSTLLGSGRGSFLRVILGIMGVMGIPKWIDIIIPGCWLRRAGERGASTGCRVNLQIRGGLRLLNCMDSDEGCNR